MMIENDLRKVEDGAAIYKNNQYVVVLAKNLWIFRFDGTLVAKCTTVCNPYKVAFLSHNRLLVDGGSDHSYHLLSLDDASTIWKISRPAKRTRPAARFAVSPDQKKAYDYYYLGGKLILERIDIATSSHRAIEISNHLRTTKDIVSTKEGNLCLLQTQIDKRGERSVSANRILMLSDCAGENCCSIAYDWETSSRIMPVLFDGNNVLFSDFSVYTPISRTFNNLLEIPRGWRPPGLSPFRCSYDLEHQYLQASYLGTDIFIDCKQQKVIAQYSTPRLKHDGKVPLPSMLVGCLVEGEYWVCSDAGIIVRPFPTVEKKIDVPFDDYVKAVFDEID